MADRSEQRVAIITGASRGIGKEAARLVAAQGRHVVCTARGADALAETVREIEAAGGSASSAALDVKDQKAIEDLIENVSQEFGRLDILVNNAGLTRDDLLLRMSDEAFDEVILVNLRSAFVATRAALRVMMRGRWGRVINISSVAGVMGNAGQTNYSAAKSGLIGFTKSVAREMAVKNITANVVAPGFTETAMTNDLPDAVKQYALNATPLKRFGTPGEIAHAIAFLTSEEAGFITGQTLAVDGGMSMC